MKVKEARRILLCLRYGIGDLVMETPALDALRREAPAAQITALGARPAIELLDGDPRIDRLVCAQDWGLEHWGDFGSARIREKILMWMARESFDLVLDPSHAVMGAAEAIRSSSTSFRDAGGEAQERALLRCKGGAAAIRAAVREGWGIEVPQNAHPSLQLTGGEYAAAERFLARQEVLGEPVVGISPVASSPLKRWPLDRFVQVTDELAETCGRVLLFYGPQRETAAALAARLRHPRRVIPVGALHLRQVAALLARCRLFIGNDTGLTHMAGAVGTPLLALFGPTSPSIYLPTQVPSVAFGGEHPCRRRLTASFGPPECVVAGRCLEGERSCIDRVPAWKVIDEVRKFSREGRRMREVPGPHPGTPDHRVPSPALYPG